MNNRGEQLEKHEILKARLLEKVNREEQRVYAKIWDACSQMNGHIQMNFEKKDRDVIFGEGLDEIHIDKIFEIKEDEGKSSTIENYNESVLAEDNTNTIEHILNNKCEEKDNNDEDDKEREDDEKFTSITSFSSFLLLILSAITDEEVSLNDAKLLEEFKKNGKDEEFAKIFIQNLLRYRVWFDRYVIKRNEVSENWSLQKMKNENKNNNTVNTYTHNEGVQNKSINDVIKMIQSMFYVSYGTSNQNWLRKIFLYFKENIDLKERPTIDGDEFIKMLEDESRTRFDAKGTKLQELSFYDKRPPIYLFNLMDYVLWKKQKGQWTSFTFKVRNSIEHFYPQNHTFSGESPSINLHHFGNLALVTKGSNSSFSNHSPEEKAKRIKNKGIDNYSLKLQLMVNYDGEWDDNAIDSHEKEMQGLLKEYYDSE